MESRKTVLMNLFAGSKGDTDTENTLTDTDVGRKEREGRIERVTLKDMYYHMENKQPVGTCGMIQGAQTWCL